MDEQVLAILVGVCALVIGLAVYVIRGLSLFPKTPSEAPPVSTPGFALSGVGFVFFGLMVICMMGSVWAVQEMEWHSKRGQSIYVPVLILVGLVFTALYFALKSRGVRIWKKPK